MTRRYHRRMTVRALTALIGCIAAATLAAGQPGAARPGSEDPGPTSSNSAAAGPSDQGGTGSSVAAGSSDPAGSGWQARADLVQQLTAKAQSGINYDETRVGS